MRRKIFLGVLGVIVLAVIVCAVLARPYLKPPPESKEALEARYAEFKKIADRLQSRPKSDIEAFLALTDELNAVLKKDTEKNKAMMGLQYGKEVGCPSVNIEDVRKSEADIKEVLSRDDRLRAIVADGFTPQQDANSSSDLPNFSWLRKYVFAQLAGAVLECDQNKPGEAAERILTLLRLSDGFLGTPFLLHNLNGAVMADRIAAISVFLAPKFTDQDLRRIRDAVSKKPDAVENMIGAMQVEIMMATDAISNPSNFKEGFSSAIPGLAWIWPVMKHTGIVKNARWNYLSLTTRIADFYAGWYRNGAKGPAPDLDDALKREFRYNIAAAIGVPNWGSLLEKARRANVHKKAMLDAIDAELAIRETGGRTKLELPYDETHKIVIDENYGCVVKNDSKK